MNPIKEVMDQVFGTDEKDSVSFDNLRKAMKIIGFDEEQIENTIIECKKFEMDV